MWVKSDCIYFKRSAGALVCEYRGADDGNDLKLNEDIYAFAKIGCFSCESVNHKKTARTDIGYVQHFAMDT